MKFKKLGFVLCIAGLFLSFACKKNQEPTPRTPEQEMEELDRVLTQKEEAGYDIDTTAMGVYYIIKQEGEGPLPQQGDTCVIEYRGFLPNGKLFDTSEDYHEDGLWEFPYRNPDIVPGLEDGIGRMNKGSKIELYIPSHLAHGSAGTEIVPPYTTLIYFIEMHDLRPRNN